jgi:hypothetical protein
MNLQKSEVKKTRLSAGSGASNKPNEIQPVQLELAGSMKSIGLIGQKLVGPNWLRNQPVQNK